MKILKYILLVTISMSALQGDGQTFFTASDTVYGTAFQCIVPPNTWRGSGSYGICPNSITFPGSPTLINWSVIASNFPPDWLNFAIADTPGFYTNTLHTLWNGTTGTQQTAVYPSTGGRFNLYIFESPDSTVGTYWMEVALKDSTSAYSKNIWFVVSRYPDALGDSIAGPVNVCPGASITLSTPASDHGAWKASNTRVSIVDSFVAGVSAGLDTISFRGPIVVYGTADTCTFTPQITKVIHVYTPPAPVVTAGAANTIYTSGGYNSYQWTFASSAIAGATTSVYTMLTNGVYAVIVSDGNGCFGTSDKFYEEYLSVPMPHSVDIEVYPNPASTGVNIKSSSRVNARLTALDGSLAAEKRNATQLDITSLPEGEYILSVYDDAGNLLDSRKITKAGQ